MTAGVGAGEPSGSGLVQPARSGTGIVRLLGYSPSLRAASYEHLDDLFRELTVIELSGDSDLGDRLRLLVTELREGFDAVVDEAQPFTQAAVDRAGDADAVDVALILDLAMRERAARLGALLDEADGLAAEGQLLTSVSSPVVRLFRDWVLHEIAEQLDGAPPVPWWEWRDAIESRWRTTVAGVDDVFRLMADAAPVFIWVVGDGGVGTFFNKRWEEFTGVDLNAGERRWSDVVHPDDRREGLATFRRAIRDGTPYEMEYRLLRRDGTYRWVLDRGVPRHDATGARVGMVGSCVDITDRRTIEDDLRVAATQAELAFEAGQMGYWRWSARSRELRVGAPILALLDVADDAELATFDDYLERVHPDDRERVVTVASSAFESGSDLRIEHRTLRADGDVRWIEIRGRPIQTDEARVTEWVGVAFDTTSSAKRSQARAEMLGHAVRARRDVERDNATLRRAVGRLDTMVRQEHAVADALQRALFTDELPRVAGLELAARYLPGSAELTVGGDWYDVIARPSSVLLVIGDVAGHGLHAAAVMARIRHSVQFAVTDTDGELSPAVVLGSINRYLLRQGNDDLATLAIVRYEPSGRICHARAGHPPVLVAPPAGGARYLEGGLGPPLGAIEGARYVDADDTVASGDTLVLYTDGLIERRREPLDRSLDRLRGVVDAAPRTPDDMLESVLGALLDDEPTDDVAVLAARPSD